ncbi:M23 family metallopeptidase [Cochleicola gelatinilyticus]|nr:M23 family metallopeptidase [Cochleicola gelatinilyticus]
MMWYIIYLGNMVRFLLYNNPMKYASYLIVGLLLLGISSCTEIQKAADVITNPSAKEVYARNFEKNDSLFLLWETRFEEAKKDSLQVLLPYAESGIFSEKILFPYSYDLQLREGERLVVEIEKPLDSTQVFIDLFKKSQDTVAPLKLIKSSEIDIPHLSEAITEYGWYKVIIQSGIGERIPFKLKIYTQPTYGFPVSGAGNKNIQSFWADPRDGGSRSHEGVDIFAKRGTPVVAITDGRVSSTGDRGLGGKQVWLRDGLFGKTMYYAHLDSIATTTGKRVKQGDTLGFVGNTGNARTTAPHLHFGIYKTASGAINPLPYIKRTDLPEISWENTMIKGSVKRNTTLQKAPISGFETIATLKKGDTVAVLGKHEAWLHVRTKDLIKGFIQERFVNELPSN